MQRYSKTFFSSEAFSSVCLFCVGAAFVLCAANAAFLVRVVTARYHFVSSVNAAVTRKWRIFEVRVISSSVSKR